MLEINEKLLFLLEEKHRFKCAYGGRNGGKSHDFATSALILGAQMPTIVVCLREYQKNLEESVHRLLCNKIMSDAALRNHYTIFKNAIIGRNGTEFVFSGIKNAKNFKSFEGADIAWVEEAQTISHESLTILIPTIRKPGSEIWFSFNPENETDPIYQLCVTNPRPNMKSVQINYLENPNCPIAMIEEAEFCRLNNPDDYPHIWLGQLKKVSDAVIFKGKYEVQEFEIEDIRGIDYFNNTRVKYRYGMDFGFSVDPFACAESFTHDHNLYITNEVYQTSLDTDDIVPVLKSTMPNLVNRFQKIYGDSARPDIINQLKRPRRHKNGEPIEALNIEAAAKGKGSVKDGIDYLRNFKKIIIHPRCVNTIKEFNNYKYKTDAATGEILATGKSAENFIIDDYNHIMDALRYTYSPEIQAARKQTTWTTADVAALSKRY